MRSNDSQVHIKISGATFRELAHTLTRYHLSRPLFIEAAILQGLHNNIALRFWQEAKKRRDGDE